MSSFLVWEICVFLLLFSGDGEGEGWIRFLHGGFVEDGGDNFGVSIFIDMSTWRFLLPNGGIKAEMMPSPWNKFLQSLLRFVVVGSDHDEGLGRILFRSVFLILRWQKEEKGRHTEEEVSQLRLQERWPSVGHLLSGRKQLLPSICLCGHLYKASNRFGVEIWSLLQHGYNIDEFRFLDRCLFFQSTSL